jgi:hypothetical protein
VKVYVAAPYAARKLAHYVAGYLDQGGFSVTSSWINGTRPITPGVLGACPDVDHETIQGHAGGDLADIDAADVVLLLTSSFVRSRLPYILEEHLHTGGRHVEVGYAIAKGKPVHIIGDPENVFERTLCMVHENLVDAAQALRFMT